MISVNTVVPVVVIIKLDSVISSVSASSVVGDDSVVKIVVTPCEGVGLAVGPWVVTITGNSCVKLLWVGDSVVVFVWVSVALFASVVLFPEIGFSVGMGSSQ